MVPILLKGFNFQLAYIFPQHLILLLFSKFYYQYLLANNNFQYYNIALPQYCIV